MKIKTLTCHHVYNYGASLQAYALMHYLESLGNDVQIIDYYPEYIRTDLPFWYINKNSHFYKYMWWNPFLRLPYSLKNWMTYRKGHKRRARFDQYTSKFLKLTNEYVTYEELVKEPPVADLYFVGSDQVWNTFFVSGSDKAFYLDFGAENTKKCSYAPSFGSPRIKPEMSRFVKDEISKLDKVSVRELSGCEILKELGIKDVANVVDPVFLLDVNQWADVISDSYVQPKGKYVLIYQLYGYNKDFKKWAGYLSKKYGYEIIAVPGTFLTYANHNYRNAGPSEFISLIKNAEFILCDSFHASAFSVIFNKQFVVLLQPEIAHSARMEDFCKLIGMPQLFRAKFEDIESLNYDWEDINKRISQQIKSSKEYIDSCLKLVQ